MGVVLQMTVPNPRELGKEEGGVTLSAMARRAISLASWSIRQFSSSRGDSVEAELSWWPLTCFVDGAMVEACQRHLMGEIRSKSFRFVLANIVLSSTCCRAPNPSHATVTLVEIVAGSMMFETNDASPSCPLVRCGMNFGC